MMTRFRFRDLPLFGKFLLPFLGLVVVLGALGTFVVVRDLSSRAEAELDAALTRSSLDARAVLRDRELYLVESASFSANLAGLATAVDRRDVAEATRLLRSVIALKRDLDLLVVAHPDGNAFLSFFPQVSGDQLVSTKNDWTEDAFIREALAHPQGAKSAGLVSIGDRTYLAVAAAVCAAAEGCAPTAVAVVGMDVNQIVGSVSSDERGHGETVALFDADGTLLASSGDRPPARVSPLPDSGLLRWTETLEGTETATLFAAWRADGRRIGTVTVGVPTAPAFASVRGAGIRLALLIFAGMVGIVALGAFISRKTTVQVRTLLETNRAIGRGELSSRAPVVGGDELGELARGVNQMAEELQASRETLEMRVQQRTEEVERLLRERNEIFASLSHELRTPLATILRQAEMMVDSSIPKNKRWNDETGSTIRASAQQLLSLVNDILELARAEAGKIDLRMETLDPAAVVEELRPTIAALARSAHLRLAVDVPSTLPKVVGDRRRLREVLLNLVDNAVKYTARDGEVGLAVSAEPDHLRFVVTDTGVGIPDDEADRIFEAFYRVRATRTQQGQASSGLGLALTKRLVEAQGGTVGFTSRAGEGSTFVVTMPLARDADQTVDRGLAKARSR